MPFAKEIVSLSSAAAEIYRERFRKVLAYIDAHLDEELGVERLSGVAAFSKFHFHRQFSELFGISVGRYIQLKRLKRASHELAFRDHRTVVDIALGSGYEGPEAFARAFRKTLGQSPSEFRKQPQWESWHTAYRPLSELRSQHMKSDCSVGEVTIVDFETTKVALLEHRGTPDRIGDTIRTFIDWRRQNGLHPSRSATFNLVHWDPNDPTDYRLDLCAATDTDVAENSAGVVGGIIPGGRCAVLRHVGTDEELEAKATYLYSEWLPRSGEEPRDFPLYLQRVRFFPDVPEHQAVVDIFLPLK